jgi:DNA-binding HxlR family transcriptional regulator
VESEPKDVMVLGAIKGGAKKFDKIKNISKIDPEELNQILERLEGRGLIIVETKKGFFGPKIEIKVTEKGEKEMQERIHELEGNWNEMNLLMKSGDKQKLQQYMDDNKSILPTMFFFGIIDMIMFSTMLGFLGSQMTDYIPADQIPGGTDGVDGSGAEGAGDGGFDIDIGF